MILNPITVANLLDTNGSGWDIPSVQTLFWENDAKSILQIPFGSRSVEDIRVWHIPNTVVTR